MRIFAIAVALLAAAHASAQEAYYSLSIDRIYTQHGLQPPQGGSSLSGLGIPRVVLAGSGEAFITGAGDWQELKDRSIVASSGKPQDVTGWLIVPSQHLDEEPVVLDFTIPASAAGANLAGAFYTAKSEHYSSLNAAGRPGAAWFRWQADKARAQVPAEVRPNVREPRRDFGANTIDDTYELLSGGTAVSENLQLFRQLTPAADASDAPEQLVDVSTITGITVPQLDWKAMNARDGGEPVLDPLASLIPADQHAFFFPSVAAVNATTREARSRLLPMAGQLRLGWENADVVGRYEHQMCVSLDSLGALIGGALADSVAVTGGDLNFPTGTSIAVIFETRQPALLKGALLTRIATQAQGAEPVQPRDGEPSFAGFATPDRRISAYVAVIGNAVVLTNSRTQLTRIAAVSAGATPSVASLPEYRFLRQRHARSKSETVFAVLSDATIRRWCGPVWRIADSRRVRAAALLSDATAQHMTELAAGTGQASTIEPAMPMRTIGVLTLQPASHAVVSSVYNRADFLTPIDELDVTKVTKDEQAAYARWRNNYQRNWSGAFDPIGLSLSITPKTLSADLSVLPLIVNTEYAMIAGVARGAAIAPQAGDPHDTIAHLAVAINTQSMGVQSLVGMAGQAGMGGLKADPLSWLGSSIALYAEPSPIWERIAKADHAEDELTKELTHLPLALHVETTGVLKTTAFIAAARTKFEETAPGMTEWKPMDHNGHGYVRVRASDQARQGGGGKPDDVDASGVYYAITPRALIVSLNEQTIKNAIDRAFAPPAPAPAAQPAAADASAPPAAADASRWLGQSLCFNASRPGLNVLEHLMGEFRTDDTLDTNGNNIAILNEWKRLFPDQDPVAVHRRLWGTRLTCPAGGSYVWNERLHTMESTKLGSPDRRPSDEALRSVRPSSPLKSIAAARFGITLEDLGAPGEGLRSQPGVVHAGEMITGLRARVEVSREPEADAPHP
ncbi:MAG: hypothetical protein QM783_06470 [Phycisphaerales bacterium]